MRRFLICALLLPAIGLAGCGGGGGDAASTDAGDAARQRQEAERKAAEAAREKRRAAAAERERRLERRFTRTLKVALRSQQGKPRKEQLRIAEAVYDLGQIAKEDLDVVAPLLRSLRKRDYDRIIQLKAFYIQLGKPGSEPMLLDALYDAGPGPTGTDLALTYLQSANNKLISSTKAWGSRHGYTISGSFTGGVKWGCLGIYDKSRRNAPTAC